MARVMVKVMCQGTDVVSWYMDVHVVYPQMRNWTCLQTAVHIAQLSHAVDRCILCYEG